MQRIFVHFFINYRLRDCESPVTACSDGNELYDWHLRWTLVIQNQEFTRKCPPGFFYDFCPLKLRQWCSDCSSEHRMCPMDFVSALMGVRRKRAAAGQLFVSNTVIVAFQWTRSEFCPRRLISTFWGRPFRQTRNFEHICVRRTIEVPQSKRCSDIKIEPGRHFRKFNDFV